MGQMNKPLSPAAQAVLDALLQAKFGAGAAELGFPQMASILARELAAVLREVINQCQNGQGVISAADLCVIADELEAQP
jgi:hypothetical protein